MDKADIFKLILTGLTKLPDAIAAMKATAHSGATKKEKALAITNESLAVLDAVAPAVRQDPKFQELVGKANDALYEAAKYGQALANTPK